VDQTIPGLRTTAQSAATGKQSHTAPIFAFSSALKNRVQEYDQVQSGNFSGTLQDIALLPQNQDMYLVGSYHTECMVISVDQDCLPEGLSVPTSWHCMKASAMIPW